MSNFIRALESYLGRFLLWVVLVVLVALLYSAKTATPDDWGAEDWEAFGTVVTALIALAAAGLAIVQLKDARDVRWEQALPYVAAYLDPDPTDPKLIYLTIKNYGATIAEDVQLSVTPEAIRSQGVGGGTLNLPQRIPALVPGQDWRTFWDFSVFRYQEQLPGRHALLISYQDSRGQRHFMESILDWQSYTLGRRWVGRKSMHHVGESVAKIEKSIGKLAATATTLARRHEGESFYEPGSAPLDAPALEDLGLAHEVEEATVESQGTPPGTDS